MTIFHHKLLTRESRNLGQWMNLMIIHNGICSYFNKKCPQNSDHSNIRYNLTLNIICSVVSMHTKEYNLVEKIIMSVKSYSHM